MLELGSSFSFNKKATLDLGIEIHRNSLESCVSDITKKVSAHCAVSNLEQLNLVSILACSHYLGIWYYFY